MRVFPRFGKHGSAGHGGLCVAQEDGSCLVCVLSERAVAGLSFRTPISGGVAYNDAGHRLYATLHLSLDAGAMGVSQTRA